MVSHGPHDPVIGFPNLYGRQPLVVQNAVRIRPFIRQYSQEKRHATYFPSDVSFDTKWNLTGGESTWAFSVPVASMVCGSSTVTSITASRNPTQDVVTGNHAGLSSASTECSDASWETAPQTPHGSCSILSEEQPASPILEKDDLKAIYRQTRADELLDALAEATGVIAIHDRQEDEGVVCNRPGCWDTLRDVKALMYHLHIHNIHDQILGGSECSYETLETSTKARQHSLAEHQELWLCSGPFSFKDILSRVLNKLTCRPSA